MTQTKPLLLFLLGFCLTHLATSQLIVDNTMTAEEAVLDVLLGEGVEVSNVTFNGVAGSEANIQIGFFDSENSNIGICRGIVLATCDVDFVVGPNQNGGGGLGSDPTNPYSDDPDLAQIEGLTAGNDQAALEFDFIPSTNSITFNYVFSSEEYPEFVNGGFNDAFGFFLSGPGINGPFENGAVNLAQIPNSTTPVTIDNVNAGDNDMGCNNCEYYVINTNNADPNSTEMDGFTIPLAAASSVVPGETYHIKMAIGNAGDSGWDSAVFLQKESFGSGIQTSAGLDEVPGFLGDTTIVEGCNVGNIAITWSDLATADTLFLEYSGTFSEDDLDTELPEFLVFTSEETTQEIEFGAVIDGIDEGVEEIIVSYSYIDECDDEVTVSASLFIIENLPPVINIPDQTLCPGTSTSFNLFPEEGIGFYEFTLDGEIIDVSQVFQTFTPAETTSYTYAISDPCGNATSGGFTITVLEAPPLEISPIEIIATCPGNEIILSAEPIGGFDPYTYSWENTITGQIIVDQSFTVNPSPTESFTLTVTDDCNFSVQTFASASQPLPSPVFWDQTIDTWCEGQSQLVEGLVGGFPPFTFHVNDPNGPIWQISGSDAQVLTTRPAGIYEVFAVDECGQFASISAEIEACELIFNNVFTPNGDGMNDTFWINNADLFGDDKLTIFDRWGVIVFEKVGYSNDWDGKNENGNEVPSGTYYYVYDPGSNENEVRTSGFFTIVR